jgi:hypothetical protein
MRATARISGPDHRHEREADRAAHAACRWMRGSQPGRVAVPPSTGAVVDRLAGWFGHDFSQVRVHAGGAAGRAATALGARAYTTGAEIVLGSAAAAPGTEAGQRLLAHELTHVVQQRGGAPATGPRQASISAAPAGAVQGQFVTPHAAGGGWGGVMERDRQRVLRQMRARRFLHFFHGTSWEVARTIPGQVRPAGGGDFAAGFYTHHDRDNARAKQRAKIWGMRIARGRKEPYAGVLDFTVPAGDFGGLLGRGRSLDFRLTRRDQPDYADRQRRWLDFVTSHGREATPTFDARRDVWRHERRDPQPHLGFNVVRGPFYQGVPGRADTEPPREDFDPYAEGRELPQQVVFANAGIDLLNSSRVRTRLEQYDANTGDRIDPPRQTPAGPLAHTPATIPPLVPPTEPLEL